MKKKISIIALVTNMICLFLKCWKAFGQRPATNDKKQYRQLMNSYYKGTFHNHETKALNVDNKNSTGKRRGDNLPINHLTNIQSPAKDELKWIWLGHSSSLLQIQGLNILIDPVFSKYASPIPFLGPKRFSKLPIEIENLPELDAVVISHDHYDHLDYHTIIKIDAKVKAYYVPLGVEKHLIRWGIDVNKIHPMAWWDKISINELEITAVPGHHFSGRLPWLNNTTLWCGYVLANNNYKIYYTGDTGYSDHFKEIKKKFGTIDLMILEDGQYDQKWKDIHLMPAQGIQAIKDIDPKWVVPVHWGAYSISFHAWNDPVKQITSLAHDDQINVATPLIGEIVDYTHLKQYQKHWW